MSQTDTNVVRIGGASGFWGDSATGPMQVVDVPGIQYITFDYLAELTMSILAAARNKKPELGYATDFVDTALRGILEKCMDKGIRIVSNAGGINPHSCARAIESLADELGCKVKVAVVDGDDITGMLPALKERGVTDFYTGAAMPARMLSANAYLGAQPIAQALKAGADIVVTGRVVDSAVVLGILMHEFGWQESDHDRLAGGSLAGHIIECGCQATGGLHTDWEQIPDWDNMGYPVVDCLADGSFLVKKPENTGGRVLAQAVAEQLLYEIGDPAAYILPDVICDFTDVRITQTGHDEVRVEGARGRAPTDSYKVSATFMDGFTCVATLSIVGLDAVAKARRSGEAIIKRVRRMLEQAGLGDLSAWNIEVIGAEDPYGDHARQYDIREAVVRITARHQDKNALVLFSREIAAPGTSWSPGTTGSMAAGRPPVSPLVRLFSFTVPKTEVVARVTLADGAALDVHPALPEPSQIGAAAIPSPLLVASPWNGGWPAPSDDDIEVPLIAIAWARSGDKGNTSNIGVIARSAAALPYLLREVTEARVLAHFRHYVKGDVTRYAVPGIRAVNFVLTSALDGGGMASMRNDPLGKAMGQILLSMPIRVPRSVVTQTTPPTTH